VTGLSLSLIFFSNSAPSQRLYVAKEEPPRNKKQLFLESSKNLNTRGKMVVFLEYPKGSM